MSIVYLVAADHGARKSIAAILSCADFSVEAFSGPQDFGALETFETDACVVVDLPDQPSGCLSRLRAIQADLPIIAISPRANVSAAVVAMKEGAADFLPKPVDERALVLSVRAALEARRQSLEAARRIRELIARYRSLSARERDVVHAVLGGSGNREVASQLGIRPRTVEAHRSNAMAKLGARSLPDLVRLWLDVEESAER